MTKCFLVIPTDRAALSLRRYVSSRDNPCPGRHGYHDASNYIQDVPVEEDGQNHTWTTRPINIDPSDPRWPTHCACGYQFRTTDEWQEFTDRLYTDGTKEYPKRTFPVGAMYFESWLPQNMYWDNLTSGHLHVVTPGGTWNIDGRASNCTVPDDRRHRCWIRHGDAPNITVDKAGLTCGAGAGSIALPGYHGFLQNGHLTGSL